MADDRERNVALVNEYLDAVGTLDIERLAAVLHEDIVLEIPFAPEGVPKRIEGKPAVIEYYSSIPDLITAPGFDGRTIDTLADPSELVAEYRSECEVIPTGRRYANTYIARASIRDGAVARFAEFFDSAVLIEALAAT
jgi:ketosteroid isomerase-like protein